MSFGVTAPPVATAIRAISFRFGTMMNAQILEIVACVASTLAAKSAWVSPFASRYFDRIMVGHITITNILFKTNYILRDIAFWHHITDK